MNSYRLMILGAAGLAACGGGVRNEHLPVGDGGARFGDQGAMVCSPSDTPACDGATIATCRADGSGFDYALCSSGCFAGACTCKPGETTCVGADVQTCGPDGVFHTTRTCTGGTRCENGGCSDARCSDETMGTNPHALPTNAWPRYRHDNRNSGSTPTAVADKPVFKWKVAAGGCNLNQGGMGSGPVVNQANIIFVTGGDQDLLKTGLHSYDGAGKELWFFPAMTGFASSTPAVRADGTSYFSVQQGGLLFAVDPMGKQAWQFPTGSQADSDPIVTKDGTLIYSSDDGSAYALDANGKPLWHTDPVTGPGEVDAGLSETCDGKIIVGGRNGIFALDAKTGNTIWHVMAQALFTSPMLTADGFTYAFDATDTGFKIDPMGNVVWSKKVGPGAFGAPGTAKIGNQLFSLLNDGNLHSVDADTGKDLWKMPVGGADREITAGPIVDGKQRIYVNGNDGLLYCFDVTGKQLWTIPTSGVAKMMDITGTPAIGNDGTIYVPGNDGFLYAFQ